MRLTVVRSSRAALQVALQRARWLSTRQKSVNTIAIHGGESVDPHTKASTPPLVLASTFSVTEPLSFSANELEEDSPYCYTRWSNPTVRALEQKLALLEGVPATNAVCFGSGMAASTATLFSFLQAGDHVVAADVNYPGVAEMFRHTLPKFGVRVTTVDASDLSSVKAAAQQPNTKMIYVETPTNPILRLCDINACADIAHGVGAELVVGEKYTIPSFLLI